ncbi:methyltransferase-like protein 17, mitochondrial [Haliotis rufescens]|uniref:methyltransferase-like protein 17, mitochondrial n=1 Tax=Haliotis rufescens TaxID=6454 RepID=UPI00201F74DE|nr:methyltransferase-like protein 17, mitochondrial [Haliotis rufescens]
MAASMRMKTQACCLYRIPSLLTREASKSHLRSCSSKVKQARHIKPGECCVDPDVAKPMTKGGISFKTHPGIMTLRPVKMPEKLSTTIKKVIDTFPVQNLNKRSEKLNNYLHSRHPPTEQDTLTRLAQEIQNNIKEKDKVDTSTMSPEEQKQYEKKISLQVLKRLRYTQYHWVPLKFDAPTCMTYLYSRMAHNYSVMMKCFTEISRRDPEYSPKSMFDFGSGLASSVWAGNRVWGPNIYEYYCVDPSQDMNTLARLLLQGGEEKKDMTISGVYFRQFLPSQKQNSFNIVTSSYTLLELPSREKRLETLLSLWQMTDDFLVLVENGSKAGFQLIDEAKEYLLQFSEEHDELEGHVFAPCPHEKACPKLAERNSPCMFGVTYKPLDMSPQGTEAKQTSRYSYVILRKGKRKHDAAWPRVIQEVVRASKHVHCHLCWPDGKLSHDILTARKHGKDVYSCVRASNWGDLFPIHLKDGSTGDTCDTDTNPGGGDTDGMEGETADVCDDSSAKPGIVDSGSYSEDRLQNVTLNKCSETFVSESWRETVRTETTRKPTWRVPVRLFSSPT